MIAEEFKFVEIRKKRNEIARDYASASEKIYELYKYVLENTKHLIDSVNRIIEYSIKYI